MSSLIYPTIAGLAFQNTRTPIWNTNLQTAVSGKESAIAYQVYPLYRFELQYEVLREKTTPSDLRAMVGLHNAMRGRFDDFLFTDPAFNAVTDEKFGWAWDGAGGGSTLANGTTTAFQLIANYQNTGGPGLPDIVQNLNGAPVIKDNGVTKTGGGVDYTLGQTGIITFTAPPTAGHALTWSGSFYYRCRFDSDELTLTQLLYALWNSDTVTLRTKIL